MRHAPASGAGGVLVIDKPRGPTSHDIVKRVRRALGVARVGHAGTLDPMATGVLVLALGEATKLVPWLTAHDKSYEATVALGVATDTLDAEGHETATSPPRADLLEALARTGGSNGSALLNRAIEAEATRSLQLPPEYSAIRQDGERAFERARRGERSTLAARPVTVLRLELVAWSDDPPSVSLSLDVAKGYYVRALARDLAAALGTVGHLTALRRTRSGCFTVGEAAPVGLAAVELQARIVSLPLAATRAMPSARLTELGAREARHGRAVPSSEVPAGTPGPCAWLGPEGDLVAIGAVDAAGYGRVLRGFTSS